MRERLGDLKEAGDILVYRVKWVSVPGVCYLQHPFITSQSMKTHTHTHTHINHWYSWNGVWNSHIEFSPQGESWIPIRTSLNTRTFSQITLHPTKDKSGKLVKPCRMFLFYLWSTTRRSQTRALHLRLTLPRNEAMISRSVVTPTTSTATFVFITLPTSCIRGDLISC